MVNKSGNRSYKPLRQALGNLACQLLGIGTDDEFRAVLIAGLMSRQGLTYEAARRRVDEAEFYRESPDWGHIG